jgi:hypothetical protein
VTPSQKKTVNGHTVTEYYWNGKYAVYIDSKLAECTFRAAVARCMTEEQRSKLV